MTPVIRIPRPVEHTLRVPIFVLKCVGFLGDPLLRTSEHDEINPQSTAFIVSLPSWSDNRRSHCYVVTARHGCKNLKGPFWFTANTKLGRIVLEPDIEAKHWYEHRSEER